MDAAGGVDMPERDRERVEDGAYHTHAHALVQEHHQEAPLGGRHHDTELELSVL